METGRQESFLKKLRTSIIVIILLIVIIFLYLWKLNDFGIPKKIVFYDKRELVVKELEALNTDELRGNKKVEGVLVIKKKEDGTFDITSYRRGGRETGSNLSVKELLLQLSSGSENAYATGHSGECEVYVYRGDVYTTC